MVHEATATIAADPATIWSILTDAAGYPDWDSGVVRIEGTIADGEKIKLVSEVDPGRTFTLKVADVRPGEGMRWSGGMPLGLFRGVRTFRPEPDGDGQTRFTLREEFSGAMAGMITKKMPDMGPSFEQFANGLKARAEAG